MNKNLISLSENVIQALDFLGNTTIPEVNLSVFELPFVVGSGNAYNTGLILFSETAAIVADESTYKQLLQAYGKAIKSGMIQDAVIISASGEKDSVWEVDESKKQGLHTTLLTTKAGSSAAKIADTVHVFQSIAEPYTYNVSTYMGMMLAVTKENPEEIKSYIEKLAYPSDFTKYDAYSFVLPDNYASICPMIDIKKSELFGPLLSLRAFPEGHARHAKFVIRTDKELVITIGSENKFYGHPKHRWNIKFPQSLSFAGMMALTYAIVGKIQDSKPPYYKEHIENYCKDYGPKAYGKDTPFEVVVPGSN